MKPDDWSINSESWVEIRQCYNLIRLYILYNPALSIYESLVEGEMAQ